MRPRVNVLNKDTYSQEWNEYPVGSYALYYALMDITDDDHQTSEDVLGWSELAAVGEIYETGRFIAEIIDLDEEED